MSTCLKEDIEAFRMAAQNQKLFSMNYHGNIKKNNIGPIYRLYVKNIRLLTT